MLVKMKKSEVITRYDRLISLKREFDLYTAYVISKNKQVLKDEFEPIREAIKASPEYAEYDHARVALAKKFSRKDASGKSVVIKSENGESYEIEDVPAFEAELDLLKEKYKESIKKHEEKNSKRETFLKEEVELDLSMLKLSKLTELRLVLSVEEMDALSFFIVDDSAEKAS